jgi:hypothetical protein
MPNQTQIDFLDELIGPDGPYFALIQEDVAFDLGTKILYLERAIHEECRVFLRLLDKLYDGRLVDEARTTNEEFIRALKLINDLCFNNPVKYGDYGTREALTHYFGCLGDVNSDEFKELIQQSIEARIHELREGHLEQVTRERVTRIQAEQDIMGQTGWRVLFDLPVAQLPPTPLGPGFFYNPIIVFDIEINYQNIQYNYIELLRSI